MHSYLGALLFVSLPKGVDIGGRAQDFDRNFGVVLAVLAFASSHPDGGVHDMATGTAGLMAFFLIALCGSALAHPHCDDGGFALVHGQWISSQWCQEELAAQYSRRHRWGYTAAQLHSRPAAMDEFCRGNDNIKFTTACAPYKD